VKARLDADGRLHVVERHAMVFTGDWNGGERRFRLFPNQQFSVEGVKRIDPATGTTIALVAGNLDEVDHYAIPEGTTLRWRIRLPSDPPFDNTEIDYEITYTLSGVLIRRGDTYQLDHNFALPDAQQPIAEITVDLDFDPVWNVPATFARQQSRRLVPAGGDFIVRADLSRSDGRVASTARAGTTRATRLMLFLLLVAGVGAIAYKFYSRESSLGRFGSRTTTSSIDAEWLQHNLLSLLPEEAGALWDDKVGAPEVAAVLARLTAEQKIESTASATEMTLRLKARHDSFKGYEKSLIDGLFYGQRHETSTADIRSHYRRSGFNPAAKIRPGLLAKLAAHKDFQDRATPPSRRLTIALLVAGTALTLVAVITFAADLGTVLGAAIWNGFWWGIGLIGATLYRKRVEKLGRWMISFAFVPALFVWIALNGVVDGGLSPLLMLAAQMLFQLAIVNSLFNAAMAREGPKKIARRRDLAMARRYFKQELTNAQPRLQDAWFPWLVALGLGRTVDHWFRSFGPAASSASSGSSISSASASSISTSASSSSAFDFGGGRSGGGGASASWSMAAGALASGVSAPSSSSGSSGGGGGGSSSGGGSSGGGGGGGW
jgi:uncharacterized membrane protein YgcG